MNEHLDNLREIRNLMERSSKFLSLSGLSGVFAGLVALIGAGRVYFKKVELTSSYNVTGIFSAKNMAEPGEFKTFLIQTAIITFLAALFFGIYFTVRKASKNGDKLWNPLSKKLVASLVIPLFAGAVFAIVLIQQLNYTLAASSTLVFYGLALLGASHFTVRDVYFLGLFEVILGILSIAFVGYSLLFWALGFGVLHIVYGLLMYLKYDK
ncbi:MAG: hypothetical protein IPH28_00085 [Cytophagaceae bacterium]|nr:hypothetical protein [Cytophagaceae bacterium]MBK9934509.1 hypothetical protein [Cytophagaceae bacterium]MBL0300957.1 hypothetical protein [Cytophagaceae bacterium]MBL0323767.1 hypothetical protein [Cytophagaceae bacterium]